ncbi:hypothetical protein MSG28_006777 [Choristoneura fumiferana]|uniref:Uncharacterized protein n=1 Tax=Choristoneura fumiferana TaxID=7141 RepID=A0ACC0JLW7_CHOFU|nr:hypothetical protein MSG28_006777 [Choristoneura fumiferana]
MDMDAPQSHVSLSLSLSLSQSSNPVKIGDQALSRPLWDRRRCLQVAVAEHISAYQLQKKIDLLRVYDNYGKYSII